MVFGLGWMSGSGGAGGEDVWTKPSDWSPLPLTQANHIDIIAAVSSDGSNFCAVKATVVGGYTVDWGDGVVENVASGVQRDHTYVYSTLGTAITSRGYKTATIQIYPQAANPITAFDLGVKNATAGLAAYANLWLYVRINAPSCSSMSFRGGVEPRLVEHIDIIAIGNITTLAFAFLQCNSLQSITFPAGSLVNVTSMLGAFLGCYALRSISFPEGSLSFVTTLSRTFEGCGSLLTVTFPAGSLVNVTALDSLFQWCGALKTVTFPAGSLAGVTTLLNVCYICSSLQSVTFPDGSLAGVTTLVDAFTSSAALKLVSFPAGSLGIVANATGVFGGCPNLSRVVNCGIPVSFTLPSNIGPIELDEIYTSLPVVVGKTVTVTGNWGVTSDTPAIATAKGWTVTG